MAYALGNPGPALAHNHRDTPPPLPKHEYDPMKCPTKELLDIWWQSRLTKDLHKITLVINTGANPSEAYRDFTDALYHTVSEQLIPSLHRIHKTQQTIRQCHHDIAPHIVIPNALVYTCMTHHARKVMNCDLGLHALAGQPLPT